MKKEEEEEEVEKEEEEMFTSVENVMGIFDEASYNTGRW